MCAQSAEVTVKSFTYNAAGRTTAVTVGNDTTTLAYDYESRFTQITYPDQSTNSFSYNGLDTRVSKVDSTGTRTYLRDGAYVTDPVLTDGAATYTPWISERRSGTTKFYHPDRLGTTERLTDTSQNTTDTRQYDAFGLLTSSSGSTPTPFGFAGAWGYQEDSDSGLKLLGHRYYDPSTGRFLTRDPIKDGRNWYSYCEGNPVAGVDDCGQQVRRITLQETGRLRDGMKLYMYHEGVTYLSLPVVVNSGIGGAMWKWKELHLSPSLLVEPPDWSRETGSLRKKLQLSDFEDKAWLASIIAHEMDHVHHNETNFVWSWNQRKVERRAWNKQIEFLETLRDSYQDDPDRVRRINNLIERAHDGLRTNG